MSYFKAIDLLRLAELATARRLGVGLAEIEEVFGVDRRTAQRMTKALEAVYPHVETRTDEERRKFWRLAGDDLRLVASQGIRDAELTALEMSIRRAQRDGAANEVESLRRLRDRLLALMPGPNKRRAETDAEALLEAQGFASRPGPRVVSDMKLLGALTEALRAPWELKITYRGAQDNGSRERLIEPHGLLLGTRRYLVGRPSHGDGLMRRFRLDRIEQASITSRSFARDPDFNLNTFAAQAFGSFHSDAEFGPVEWRFTAEAAQTAQQFIFHPQQEMVEHADGSLTVRFAASGLMEMAWHLYQWGDQVEVMAPERLREMVAGHRRNDFPALP
ncbi:MULTISPECIES: YafY family protein [unclassified Ruegeria]|uniref:helix-turn-helix transcriptional regulator n=1 Tax=unclassified Ruegeria TaxID=2625375 RepID=UPI00149152A1|nr:MULTISPECIES: WYL domain-containing protein [unclassified Ruegeria]NOD36640.1 WYL domain-containing protein [Ruegeria sp. HKCCD7296]NOE43861.1 WYL domain-containing protein [Ruegeria sp. HKCCD7319]